MSPWVTGGLILLCLAHLGPGLWAFVAPRHFFDTFPGFGHHWTAAYPPFNEHLITDLGATNITLGVLLLIAVVVADRRVRMVVLAGVLTFATLHLLFHAFDPGHLAGTELLASRISVVVGAAFPLALLWLVWRERHRMSAQTPLREGRRYGDPHGSR